MKPQCVTSDDDGIYFWLDVRFISDCILKEYGDGLTFKVTTVRLPEETIEALDDLTEKLQRERSDVMREALQIGIGEMRLRLALELYSRGKISFGRMAELTGLGYRELSIELRRRKVPLRYGEERFMKEVERLVG